MMNANNDPTHPTTTSGPHFRNVREEDLKEYKECLFSSCYKIGLPCAILVESLYHFKYLEKPKTLTHRGLFFIGNIIFGSFVYAPVCVNRFLKVQKEFVEEENKKKITNIFPVTEDTQPVTRVDEFSYPADMMTNLTEPETNFSSDFSSSTKVSDVSVEKDLKTPGTTYEDLRAQNRKNFAYESPVSSFTSEYSSAPSSNTPPVNKAPAYPSPPRRVVRNKYGDEIE